MKVNKIDNNIPAKSTVMVKCGNYNLEEPVKVSVQKVYASNLGFRGGVPTTALINDYKWFINCDKIPAIKSFLKLDAPKESLESALRTILGSEEHSYQFVDSIVNLPREANDILVKLKSKLPANSKILETYNPMSEYCIAYNKYLSKRLDNASSISELIKIRPDWSGDVLLKKHQELYHNKNFEIGIVPDSIGQENFHEVIAYLRNHLQYGSKYEVDINDLCISGKTFKFKNCIDGRSDKNIFQVETSDGQKFIIKIAKLENKSLDDSFALGTCCKIDSYLTQNKCRNSAPLRYYSYDDNSAIYDYIEHVKPERLYDINHETTRIADYRALGMTANDTVGANNYFVLDNSQKAMRSTNGFEEGVAKGELISVDNDHATYYNSLAPRVYGLNKELPNGMIGMFF